LGRDGFWWGEVSRKPFLPRPGHPGFGVVFSVVLGSATLYGGEGEATGYSAGSRYDLTNLSGEARMVLRVDGTGAIHVLVELPPPNPQIDHMDASTVTLSPDVIINNPP
jgi:hypothetical protein